LEAIVYYGKEKTLLNNASQLFTNMNGNKVAKELG